MKARDLAENPGNYTRTTSYGAAKYVKKIDYDKETGEILASSSILSLDEEKIREEEALDGYYMLLTSEMEASDDEIIDMYRGLWRIEESFKVTKSELECNQRAQTDGFAEQNGRDAERADLTCRY